jgi:diadenosine tetraphosphate (Ap4A) HIT family hydrolase
MHKNLGIQFDIKSELASGRLPAHFQRKLHRKTRILLETESLVLLPTVSPLAVGHLLVFFKQDASSFAEAHQLNGRVLYELKEIAEQVELRFGRTVLFEHGSFGRENYACGVTRAHIHFLPEALVDFQELSSAIADVLGNSVDHLHHWISNSRLQHSEYLAIGRLGDLSRTWARHDIPSQLVRQILAKRLGHSHWDWKELSGWDVMAQTLMHWTQGQLRHDAPPNRRSVLFA